MSYRQTGRTLTQWKTHDIKDRMEVLKSQIDQMELEINDPYIYTPNHKKRTLKGVQTRFSEMEKVLQGRNA